MCVCIEEEKAISSCGIKTEMEDYPKKAMKSSMADDIYRRKCRNNVQIIENVNGG